MQKSRRRKINADELGARLRNYFHPLLLRCLPQAFGCNPLYEYFDQGFHKRCFDNWDKKKIVEELVQKAIDEFIESDFYKEAEKKYGKPKWVEERNKTTANTQANKSRGVNLPASKHFGKK